MGPKARSRNQAGASIDPAGGHAPHLVQRVQERHECLVGVVLVHAEELGAAIGQPLLDHRCGAAGGSEGHAAARVWLSDRDGAVVTGGSRA